MIFQTFVRVFGLVHDGRVDSRTSEQGNLSEYSRYCLPCDKAIFEWWERVRKPDRVRFFI